MIYYVNISIDTTGADGLTKETPLGFFEFRDRTDWVMGDPNHDNDTFRLRGRRLYSNALDIGHAAVLERWDGFLDEPWGLELNGNALSIRENIREVEGGILTTADWNLYGIDIFYIRNMFFQGSLSFQGARDYYIEGCTLGDGDWNLTTDNIQITLKNSIIKIRQLVNLNAGCQLFLKDTAINKSKEYIQAASLWGPSSDNGHNQFEWTTWVTWPSDALVLKQSDLVFPDVRVTGSGVYIGYEFDLFGNVRGGIGAVAPLININTRDGSLIRLLGDNSSVVVSNVVGEGVID